MPVSDHLKAFTLEMLIIVIGIIGLLVLLGLGMAWRNYQRRQKQLDERHRKADQGEDELSIWEQAGRRYREPDKGEDKGEDKEDEEKKE